MVGRSHYKQREGEENIFSMMQNSGRGCYTHAHAHKHRQQAWEREQWEGHPEHLKNSLLQHQKAKTETGLSGHKIFS